MAATDLNMRPPGALAGGSAPGATTRTRLAWPVVLYLICTVAPIGFSLGSVVLNTQRLMLLVLTVPLMLQILAGRYGGLRLSDIFFPLHILWAGVALSVNNPSQMIQQTGSVGIEFLGGYAIARAFIRTADDFRALIRMLLLIVLCMLPLAIFETITGRPILIELIRAIPGVFSSAPVSIGERLGLQRVQLAFAHPIHFGLFCATILPLVFVGLSDTMSPGRRYVATAIVGGCGFLALSSGALLAIALQIGLISWSVMFRNVEQRWWILVALFAFMYVVIDLLSNRSPYQVFLSYATFSSHTAYWRSIILDWGVANVIGSSEKGIVGNPVFGIGLNDWIRPSYMHSGSMDNFWLVNAVRYGLPGFLFLAAGYLTGIVKVMRRDFTSDPALTLLRRAWVFSFLGLTFTLSTVHVWSTLYSYVFFLFGAGLWMVTVTPGQATEADPEAAAPAPRRGPRFTRFDPEAAPPAAAPAAPSPYRRPQSP